MGNLTNEIKKIKRHECLLCLEPIQTSNFAGNRRIYVTVNRYLSYSNRHADLLFELVSRRYESKSTIVTTNKAFSEWPQVFPNAGCVVSLVDRLIHHSEIISIEGESYRLKEAKERSEQRGKQRQKVKS